MWNAVEKIRGNEKADTIDVYEAMDMFLPGLFAYLSVLDGGKPAEIPNLRDKAVRERFREDTRCTDPKAAGEQLLPGSSAPIPDISEEVYEKIREEWEQSLKKE